MKILITGGAGYIGSVLVPKLLLSGHEVTVIDNFMFNQVTLLDACKFDSFTIIRGDAKDRNLITESVKNSDVIIPLAALVGAPLCALKPDEANQINYEEIKFLTKIVSKEQIILMPVSNSGYGIGEKDKFCTEESPLNPISLYGTTKVEAEKEILSRENSISFRLATVFGMSNRMRTDLLVNDFVYRAFHDKTLVIFEGHFKRNYIHIQDVAEVFEYALDNFDNMKGSTYNVGLDNANFSKLELAEIIANFLPNFKFIEAPIGEDPDKRDYIVSNAKLGLTGFKTKWSLERGIKELIKGYAMIKDRSFANI